MSVLSKEADVAVRWSTAERMAALKRIVPKKSITKALRRAGKGQRHCRRLPRWFMVWFVIAIGLFCRDSYRQVFRWLHRFRRGFIPGRSTLCEARKSLGVAPLRYLAEEVIQLQAQPDTDQGFFDGMRLMALDSFVLDVADTPANERAFGRPKSGRAPGAFPQARVLGLCEVGTHIFWQSLIKPHNRGEIPMAHHLVRFHYSGILSFAKLMCEAAMIADCPPLQLSFVNTLKILRSRLPEAPRSPKGLTRWYEDLLSEVAEERLAPRRDRINPRVIKRKMSSWAKKGPKHRTSPQPTKNFRRSLVMLN